MRKIIALSAAALLVLSAGAAEARGCMKGAVVGGVVGHFAGHHALAGAAIGCVVAHHHAKVEDRRARAYYKHHR
ncbi:MAG TPA: hypothetical protein VIJ94_19385 [Caulobacteraceae bacterium]